MISDMDYSQYLNTIFPGIKIQKISVNAGFSCPNRDGTIGTGGCTYCRNDSFSPSYCLSGDPIEVQIERGKAFFSRKYPNMKYLAFFQSYTNTYGRPVEEIIKLYERAISCEDIVGLIIATRPDTMAEQILDYLECLNKKLPVFLEIGAETSNDYTLKVINRGHLWSDVVRVINNAAKRKLHCGLHLIAGLPGEDEKQILENVRNACSLPIETLKIHHLQVLLDTPILHQWKSGKIQLTPFELEDYLDLCVKIISIVPSHIVIERFLAQSPPDMVVAPKWGLKNYQFMNLLKKRFSNVQEV
ncbi:MAG: TIGR01212 family radical SAM protein [Muribaculaceae bacterium]|nr:TIGR01212 family radical SAM protein [Muribaculaceae bacterium]